MRNRWLNTCCFVACLLSLGGGLDAKDRREVVVYCALDEPFSAPIIQAFQEESGIVVKTIYDSEAVKTAGLVNRLIAEKERPQCDIFWNNEKLRTVMLAEKGMLAKYEPAAWKSRNLPHDTKGGRWTEFAARARVIVYNTKNSAIAAYFKKGASSTATFNPREELAWLDHPSLARQLAISYPLFGTGSTLFLDLIRTQRANHVNVEKWLAGLMARKPVICASNSDVVRRVSSGQASVGLTDSDDVLVAQSRGEPVDFIFPEAGDRERGTMLIPNTVAVMESAPHRSEAETFINFLLTEKTELALARGVAKQIPLGKIDPIVKSTLPFFSGPHSLGKTRNADEEDLAQNLNSDLELLRKAFGQ